MGAKAAAEPATAASTASFIMVTIGRKSALKCSLEYCAKGRMWQKNNLIEEEIETPTSNNQALEAVSPLITLKASREVVLRIYLPLNKPMLRKSF